MDLEQHVEAAFAPGGVLSRTTDHFMPRRGQTDMAMAVSRTVQDGGQLVVEAGTGVGKSLAYLVPAVQWAVENKRKAVISTYTINLQEQLMYKDLPILQKILPVEFDAILWKGRGNFLCPMRLQRAIAQSDGLFTSPERVNSQPFLALRVGSTQSNMSMPAATPATMSSGVPTPIR